MNTIVEALFHTPIWVYVLFIYLLWIGIKASKTRVVPLAKIFIIPAIFSFLSIHTLLMAFEIHLLEISVWVGAILIGSLLGCFDVYRNFNDIKVDKHQHLIQIPGTWMTLILILIIFSSKYYFSYELAVDPKLINQTWFEMFMLTVSGICTGIFIGRLFSYLYKYSRSQHVSLQKKNS